MNLNGPVYAAVDPETKEVLSWVDGECIGDADEVSHNLEIVKEINPDISFEILSLNISWSFTETLTEDELEKKAS